MDLERQMELKLTNDNSRFYLRHHHPLQLHETNY